VIPIKEHALRDALFHEMHARTPEALTGSERGSHLALLTDEYAAQEDREHLSKLCLQFGIPVPAADAKHFSADFGDFRLKWERHTEFCSYTFFKQGAFDSPFADPVIGHVPEDWLAGVPGELLTAVHFAVIQVDTLAPDEESVCAYFGDNPLFGSVVAGGLGGVWSDLRLHEDRFSRVLVYNREMTPRQVGRLVQRFLEISSYRMLSLLSLPLAQEVTQPLRCIDQELAELSLEMTHDHGTEKDVELQERLSRLAGQVEQIRARTSYRFDATKAYYDLVERKLLTLREQRIEGVQTFSEFLATRLTPAIRTCESTAARQESLSQRVNRVASILRARVEVELEKQNRDLLASMDKRAKVQLRMQETVEGLSVVAITYYVVGLVSYCLKGLKAFGLQVDSDIGAGIALPVVVLMVWGGVKQIRKMLVHSDHAQDG
jgi:uncharacterized membrane-anchored protein